MSGEGEIQSRRSSDTHEKPPMVIESFPVKRSLVLYAGDSSSINTYSEGVDDAASEELKETTFKDGAFWSRQNSHAQLGKPQFALQANTDNKRAPNFSSQANLNFFNATTELKKVVPN